MSAEQLKCRTVCVQVEVSNVDHPQVTEKGGGVITMGDCHVMIQKVCSWSIIGNLFGDNTSFIYFTKELV